MVLPNGYKMTTTFWQDFSIADVFGINAVQDTFKRAFTEWKGNYVYLTELTIVANWKCWEWYDKDNYEMTICYKAMYELLDEYALDNLKGDELQFFLDTTD